MQTNFESFVAGYLECAAWASNDDGHDGLESFEFSPSAVLAAQADCRAFIEACGPLIEQAAEVREWSSLGHDFWLNRCGHGTGFWDRDELTELTPCATVYGVKRWGGPCYSTDSRNDLGHALGDIASGTSRAIGQFEGADAYLGDDSLIYFS